MTIRVGLFGAGWAARAVHGPALRDYAARSGGISLEVICDLSAERAEEVREMFGFRRAAVSLEHVLASGEIDAAIVAVSVAHNAPVASACIRAGVPTLMEKPPALTARKVIALARTVSRADAPLMVAFNRRFAPVVLTLKKAARQAGPVQSLRAEMRRVARTDPDFSTTAIHVVDALRFLADADYAALDVVYGRCGGNLGSHHPDTVVSMHALGTMKTGVPVQIDVVPCAGVACEQYTIVAAGRTFIAGQGLGKAADTLVEWCEGKPRDIPITVPSPAQHDTGGFYQEDAAFLDALKAGSPLPGPSIEDSVQSVRIMETLSLRRPRFRD